MKKLLFIPIIFLCLSYYAQAQLVPVYNIPSPDVASLGEYCRVPVSPFTGVANVSIPLCQVDVGSYSLPITANYHPASVKANSPSGSLGVGWSLMAGGYITRKVNGILDEKYYTLGKGTKIMSSGYYYNAYRLKNIDSVKFIELNRLSMDLSEENTFELSADEFAFNFCGYSGNFYYNEDGGWTVASDDNIKVIFEPTNGGFVSPTQLENSGRIKCNDWDHKDLNERFFNKFTLQTPDGCQYEFGGYNATEFSAPYFNRRNSDLIPTTWRLAKITTVDKKVIEFTYDTSSIICEIKYAPRAKRVMLNGYPTDSAISLWQNGLSGFLLFPVNLKKITTPNQVIDFLYTSDSYFTNGFTHNNISYLGWINDNSMYFNLFDKIGSDNQPYNQFHIFLGFANPRYMSSDKELCEEIGGKLKNLLLKSITISNLTYGANRKVKFEYTSSVTQRRKLLSIREADMNAFSIAPNMVAPNPHPPTAPNLDDLLEKPGSAEDRVHRFSYYKPMPVSLISSGADLWGYYNKEKIVFINNNGYDFPTPSVNTVDPFYDILHEIHYPTGGKIEFRYDGHKYKKSQHPSRRMFDNYSGSTGGARIKDITKYDSENNIVEIKRYHYLSSLPNTPGSLYSGVLNNQPVLSCNYIMPNKGSVYMSTQGGYFAVSSNNNSPDVGYSHVIEETLNAAEEVQERIRYSYTNFDEDIYGQMHFDDPAWFSMINNNHSINPYTSRSMERGKILSKKYYDRNDKLIKQETYHYKRTDSTYLNLAHQIPLILVNKNVKDIAIGYLTKVHLYSYLVDTVRETLYTDVANAKIEKIQTSDYNALKFLKKQTTTTSQGDIRTIEYEYNSDAPFSWNFVSNLITKIITKQNGQTRAEIFDYNHNGNNIPYLSTITNVVNDDPVQVAYAVKRISNNSKPIEIEQNGVTSMVLWGYGGQKIIAKIVNLSVERAMELPEMSAFDYNDNWETKYDAINSIRHKLQYSQFYTYTYDNMLQLSSITNPNGITEFFNYDYFGRLLERYYTEKSENQWRKHILNSYIYFYKIPTL